MRGGLWCGFHSSNNTKKTDREPRTSCRCWHFRELCKRSHWLLAREQQNRPSLSWAAYSVRWIQDQSCLQWWGLLSVVSLSSLGKIFKMVGANNGVDKEASGCGGDDEWWRCVLCLQKPSQTWTYVSSLMEFSSFMASFSPSCTASWGWDTHSHTPQLWKCRSVSYGCVSGIQSFLICSLFLHKSFCV